MLQSILYPTTTKRNVDSGKFVWHGQVDVLDYHLEEEHIAFLYHWCHQIFRTCLLSHNFGQSNLLWRTSWCSATLYTLDALTPYDTKGAQWLIPERDTILTFCLLYFGNNPTHCLPQTHSFTEDNPSVANYGTAIMVILLELTRELALVHSQRIYEQWRKKAASVSSCMATEGRHFPLSHLSMLLSCQTMGNAHNKGFQLCATERVLKCTQTHCLTFYSSQYLGGKTLWFAQICIKIWRFHLLFTLTKGESWSAQPNGTSSLPIALHANNWKALRIVVLPSLPSLLTYPRWCKTLENCALGNVRIW